MKRLYLIRHAKSSWDNSALDDFDRPLNNRGKRNAPFMGKRLKNYNDRPDLILSSPAKRVLKTAKLIAEEVDYPKDKIVTDSSIYEAGVLDLIKIIQNIDDVHDIIMLFGHNPGFSRLANFLTDYHVENMPTCAVFCAEFQIYSWKDVSEGSGNFAFFDYPKKHLKED